MQYFRNIQTSEANDSPWRTEEGMRGNRQLSCHATTHQELQNQVPQHCPQVLLPREIDRYKTWCCTTTDLCTVFWGNWWALTCSGQTSDLILCSLNLLWTDTVSKSRRTVLIAKDSESSWAQGKCAACKLDGFPISRARVCQEGYGQWKQLLQTANLPISLLITTSAHCAERGIPIMVAQESLQVGLCLSLLILSMQRSGLLKFLNICLVKVPVCIF